MLPKSSSSSSSVALFFWIIFLLEQCVQIEPCYRSPSGETTTLACGRKNCSHGAECVLSYDGRTVECACAEKCPSYGDSRGSRLVCGSDGRDYPNLCELNRHSCEFNKEIFVRYNGSCDPCYGVKCPASQICQIDENRNPICKCNSACGKEFEPVCGSDGKTYINECSLRVEACRSAKSLRMLHQKACAENNACRALKCSQYQNCEINRYGIATCQCPSSCTKVLKAVCGTDGQTYDSECDLKLQACINHRNISVRYMGACDMENFCHKNHGICKYGSVCGLSRNGNYTCLCPQCPEEYSPVCGSNSITYKNLCKFRQDMCEKQINNVTFSDGPCLGCENVNCLFYSKCEANEQGGQCVCPADCQQNYDPVCGSDLITYINECELRVSSCKKRQHNIIIKRGPCNSCQNVHCEFGAHCENGVCVCPKKCPSYIEPICGSNNVTYENHCQLMVSACSSLKNINVQYKGPCERIPLLKIPESFNQPCEHNTCKYGGVCVVDSETDRQHCFCNFNCTIFSKSSAEKICGSDGRIYENECVFREEICIRQQDIRKMDMIYCKKFLNIPCQGEPPLVNEFTKQELDCKYQTCPKDSYCHKGPDFAKCCQELDFEEDCSETVFGCCPDQKTPALGPNQSGCPSTCQCNRLGSYLAKCQPHSKQCYCKPGVGGLRCDRCEAGYWGLHKISEGNAGCIHCKCNKIGSSRIDCEQMTGRCVCKPGFQGMKCDICSTDTFGHMDRCPLDSNQTAYNRVLFSSCSEDDHCQHNAICRDSQCVCDFECPLPENGHQEVCASDGKIYESECHLKLYSCRTQKPILPTPMQRCYSTTGVVEEDSATTSPVRRSTRYQTSYDRLTKVQDSFENDLHEMNSLPTLPTNLDYDDDDDDGGGGGGETPNQPPTVSNSVHFDGQSFIEMDTLKAHSKVSISVEIIPFQEDGIILFNGQTSTGDGDYIGLILKNSLVELRFNLGSGTVVLRGSKPIKLGQKHSIQIDRQYAEASLSINGGGDPVLGKSDGPHKLLDLGHNLYLGGLPATNFKRFSDLLTVKRNFTGCMQSLVINQEKIPLEQRNYQITDITTNNMNWINVGDCDERWCSKTFCQNGGVCMKRKDPHSFFNQFYCDCPNLFVGEQCESRICSGHRCTFCQNHRHLCNQSNSLDVLDFRNQSYLQLPTLQGVSQTFVIEVWFMTRTQNGLVIFNGHSQGDFLELILKDGYLYFDFNLGDPFNKTVSASLQSARRLNIGEWHRVVINRHHKTGTLQVDDDPPITDTAKGNLNELNLNRPLYLGGMPNDQDRSFNGALERLVVNGLIQKNLIDKAIELVNVQPYLGPPCGPNNGQCMNGGRCVPLLDNFVCRCEPDYHGEFCEKHIEKSSNSRRYVNNTTHGTTVDLNLGNHQKNLIELELRTRGQNGLILWLSNSFNDSTTSLLTSDYLALILVDGFVEFSFNLAGKQSTYFSIRSTVKVNDGELHQILLSRDKRIGIIEIDEKYMYSGVSPEGATDLNTNGKLWLGGCTLLPVGLPPSSYQRFVGCIQTIKVEGQMIMENSVLNNLFECQMM